jgi:hypothetical protein
LPSKQKPILERRPTPDGEDNPNHRALPTFFGGDEGKFLGRCIWRDPAGLEAVVGSGFAAAAGPLYEIFPKAVAEGHSHVEAAEICGRSRGSASSLYTRPGVKERIAELRAIAATANEKAVAENGRQEVPVIDFSRNHIVVGIHELAREARSERVRLAAWSKLAEIFMLLPRQTKDLNSRSVRPVSTGHRCVPNVLACPPSARFPTRWK